MSKVGELVVGSTVELFFLLLAVGILWRVWGSFLPTPQRQRILAFQRGVLLLNDKVEKVLAPGSYWVTPKRTLVVCDMRPKPFQVATQDIQAADEMLLRISLGGEYQISDPAKFVSQNSNSFDAFYLELRQALRTAAREFEGHSIIAEQSALIARVKELTIPRGDQLGVDLIQLDAWETTPIGWFREAASS
jgi:regulator of protease activity HflC (stomatin/prohibitin superfamily)